MNVILKFLGSRGKAAMEEIISTKVKDHAVPDDLSFQGDLAYAGADGTSLAADVYRPKDTSSDPLPIAVFVHGGGFFVGSRKSNQAYAELLAQRGYVVFIPEYRLIDEGDGLNAIADVCAGLTYLKDHASELGGDLTRLLVIGESAGAFLALYATALAHSPWLRETLGVNAPELSVRGLASFGGMLYTANNDPLGLVYRRDLFGERLDDETFKALVNPEDPRIEMRLPHVLQVTSNADFLKSYTLRYNKALSVVGHPHRLIYFQKGKELTHAFPSLKPELPQSREVLRELDAWFRGLCA